MNRTTVINDSDNASLSDIKETYRRVQQLAHLALIISVVALPVYLFYSLYLSVMLLSIIIVGLCTCIYFNTKGYYKFTRPVMLILVMTTLMALVFANGLATGGYLYFLPLLFAIPLTIEGKKTNTKELIFYFLINSSFFCTCIVFGPHKSTLMTMSDEVIEVLYYFNTSGVMLSSVVLVYFSFHFEQKYAAALVKQIAKAEDAMQTRTQFLSNMGHELRTPLNGIIGVTNLLRKQPVSQIESEYLNILNYCSDQMLELVNDVLDFSKIEVGQLALHPTVFNIKHTLEQAALPFYIRFKEKNLALSIKLDLDVDDTILADDLRLIQVINNLLSNALKFTHSGEVILTGECLRKDPNGMLVKFSVQDTGIGIDEQYQKKIFESFEQVINANTRMMQGTGLGLTISQRLLELMNSKLQVTSIPGQGSTFYFECLFERALPVLLKKEEDLAFCDLTGKSVLVVEDDQINSMIVTKMLNDWNATVYTADNGTLALNALASNSRYNVILMDLHMPEMDGYEAIGTIKRLYEGIPVIAFTASKVDEQLQTELSSLGFDGYLSKPFKAAELYREIKAVSNNDVEVKLYT